MTAIKTLATAVLLVVGSSPTGLADLVSRSHDDASLIHDSAQDLTKVPGGDLPGQAYLNYGYLPGRPADLANAGLWWMPLTSAEFTSLYTRFDPIGPPGKAPQPNGSKVILDSGPDDHVSSVEMIYGTSLTGADFDFHRGDATSPAAVRLYAWSGEPDAPIIPEPTSIVLVISGIVGPGLFWRVRLMLGRARARFRIG